MRCKKILLYIPFWLNLYAHRSVQPQVQQPALHSILVKSIPKLRNGFSAHKMLYIPFWLNLYWLSQLCGFSDFDFTFHSG